MKLLFINVYLPHEDNGANLDEFNFQLSIVNNVIELHQECEIILGGDFNVNLSRIWSHTDLLNNFCNGTKFTRLLKRL